MPLLYLKFLIVGKKNKPMFRVKKKKKTYQPKNNTRC